MKKQIDLTKNPYMRKAIKQIAHNKKRAGKMMLKMREGRASDKEIKKFMEQEFDKIIKSEKKKKESKMKKVIEKDKKGLEKCQTCGSRTRKKDSGFIVGMANESFRWFCSKKCLKAWAKK